jgi:uracil-DNA glycosylase family 4
MKKTTGVVKKSSKDVNIQRLKILTKFLVSRDYRLLDMLLQYEEHYQILINRCFTYFIGYPKVINYLNEYLNHKYDAPQKKDFSKWLFTFSEIARMYNINSTNDLYFSKYRVSDRQTFDNTLDQYYESINVQINGAEKTALFLLYSKNIITEQHIEKLKSIISGKDIITENEKKLENIIKPFENTKRDVASDFSPQVKKFIESAKSYIKNRPVCKNCPMYSRGSVILDTNTNNIQPVDIAFIGLNPGYDEYKGQKPFIGKSGQLLHKFLDPLISKYNLSYIITNSILCWSKNATDITNINQVLKNCKQLTGEIHKAFPSKIKVLLGADAMKSVGVKGGITKLNGTFVDNTFFIIYHPSYILREARKLSEFEIAFLKLEALIKNGVNPNKTNKNDQIPSPDGKISIPEKSIIHKFDNSVTLFDVQVINEKIIYIMIDADGNKKYLVDDVKFPVHIKYGNYKDCEYISDMIDDTIYLTAQQRKDLNQKLYYDLKSKTNLNPK